MYPFLMSYKIFPMYLFWIISNILAFVMPLVDIISTWFTILDIARYLTLHALSVFILSLQINRKKCHCIRWFNQFECLGISNLTIARLVGHCYQRASSTLTRTPRLLCTLVECPHHNHGFMPNDVK